MDIIAEKTNYKKLADGTWGAWIAVEYTGKMANIEVGTKVEITTRNGETHTRIVWKMLEAYKSGAVVSLIEKQTEKEENLPAFNTLPGVCTPCPICGDYCENYCANL